RRISHLSAFRLFSMKKALLTLSPLLFSCFIFAQPMPCGDPAAMQPFCADACVVCDIDGFQGINSDQTQGQVPPGFCTTQAHHLQWIAFIAGTEDLTIQVQVGACQSTFGIEVGIYQSFDCQTFQLVSNCNTECLPNQNFNFQNTVPLTVGQHYYFVMDGSNDDVCNYTIEVLEGTTNVSELTNSGAIQGVNATCPGVPQIFHAEGQVGATLFNWTLNGAPLATGQTIEHTFTTPGTYQLCVTDANACDEAPPSCSFIEVQPLPPTVFSAALCPGECFDVADTTLCQTGSYEFHFTNVGGCDSVVLAEIQEFPSAVTNLDLMICEGDTLFVAGKPFYETGIFQETLTTWRGCDSIINLDLFVIVCEIQGDILVNDVACFGGYTGSIVFSVTDGTPPFNYTWERIGETSPSGQGTLTGVNVNETLTQLPVGTYLITVKDDFGHDLVLIGEVTQPEPLSLSFQASDFQGFQVSCAGGADGVLAAQPGGGMPPYSYFWSNGSQSATLQNVLAGEYLATVSDAFGCTLTGNFTLTQPPPLVLAANFENPNCDGLETGSASILAASGGIPPYQYATSGGDFGEVKEFTGLGQGSYVLTVQDSNGCTADTTGHLVAPAIPVIDLGEDLTIELAEITRLHLAYNVPLETYAWSQQPGLSCYDCLEPDAMPYETTTFSLTVSSFDDCLTSDSITVNVLKIRPVYIPNVF
ncbi:MAG: hypothetical protein AAB316_02910, partial [Bacteroidota bacterium]